MKLSPFERMLVARWKRWGWSQFEIMSELKEYRWQKKHNDKGVEPC